MNHIKMFLSLTIVHAVFILISFAIHILRSIVEFHGVGIDSISRELCSPSSVINLFVVIEDDAWFLPLRLFC